MNKTIESAFDKDYPLEGEQYIGSALEVYEKGFIAGAKHAEMLMGLLEKEVKQRLLQNMDNINLHTLDRDLESDWQSYCKEHGLQSPENKKS